MQTRRFLPALYAAAAGLFSGKSSRAIIPDTLADATNTPREDRIFAGTPSGNSGASMRWRQKMSRPHGRRGKRNSRPVPTILTNPKFMSRGQRERYAKGFVIYV